MEAPGPGLLALIFAAFTFSYVGAAAVAWLPKDAVRPLILVLLVVAAVYTLKQKEFGEEHRAAIANCFTPCCAAA